MKLRKSQRIMSLFLSLLMLLSTFAGSGFTVRAAEPTEVEAGDLDETSAAPTEVEGEELDPDASTADITIKFVYTDTEVVVLDPLSVNGETAIKTTGSNDYKVGSDTNAISWDSSKDLELELVPLKGSKLETEATLKGKVGAKYTYTDTDGTAHSGVDLSSSQFVLTRNGDKSATLKINEGVMGLLVSSSKSDTTPVITVTADSGSTAADSFYIQVDPETIIKYEDATKAITANYISNTTDLTVSLSGHERSDFPLTGVEVYLDGEKQTAASTNTKVGTSGSDDGVYWFTSVSNIALAYEFINAAYESGKTILIKGVSKNYTIEQDAANKAKYGSELVFTQGSAKTRSTLYDTTPITVTSPANPEGVSGRALAGISYVVTYSNGTTKEGEDNATPFQIPVADLTSGDAYATKVVVSGEYNETVQWKTGTGYTISETGLTSGTPNTTILTGADKAFVFPNGEDVELDVVGTAGYAVSKVEYTVGTSTTKKEASKTANTSIYTIPKADVNNIISVYVTTESASRLIGVRGAGISNVTVKDVETGTALTSSDQDLATVGKDFLFTVTGNTGYSVSKVQYTLNGGALDADNSPLATTVDATKGIYKIPASVLTGEMNVYIYVTTGDLKKVIIPKNPKVLLYVGSEAKEEDFYVTKGKAFTFSIKPRKGTYDGDVTVSKVSITGPTTITDTATDDTPVKESYTLSDSVMNQAGDLTVQVDTTEKAKGSAYSVKFASDANGIWAGEWKAGKDDANETYTGRVQKTTDETLYVAVKDTNKTVLTPTLTYTKATSLTANTTVASASLATSAYTKADAAGTKYEQVSELKDTARVVIAGQTSSAATADIQGNQVGKEQVRYTFVLDDTYGSTEHNYVSFTGLINVEVKPHYEISLSTTPADASVVAVESTVKAATNSDAKAAAAAVSSVTNQVRVTLKAINAVTRADATINDSDISWDASSAPWYVTPGKSITSSALANDQTAQIVAGAAAPARSFNVTVKDGKDADGKDITYTAATPVTLEAVEAEKIGVTATIAIEGGATDWTKTTSPAITLDATTLKKATVTYSVYKIEETAPTAHDEWSKFTTETDIKEGVEKKYLTDVTSSAAIAMDYYKTGDADKTKLSGLSISPASGSEYSLTASAKTDSTTTMYTTVTYNKVSYPAPQPVITVNKSVAKISVPLQLKDSSVAHKLNSAYLGKFNKDDYSEGYNGTTTSKDDGYLFQIPAGTRFVLPTEGDLDTTVFTDAAKTKTLVGWTVTTTTSGTIHGTTTLSGVVYMPGTTLVVDKAFGAGDSIVPKWADRYSIGANLYRNPDGEAEYDIVTNSLKDNVVTATVSKGTKPKTSESLAAATIPVGSNIAIGAKLTNNIAYAAGSYADGTKYTPDGGSEASTINQSNVLYPANGTGSGQIAWYTYDLAAGASSIGTTRSDAIAAGATDAQKKALSDALEAAKNIDKTQLASGKLVGKTEGKASVYAVYTDNYGNKYYSNEILITVAGTAASWTIDTDKLLINSDGDAHEIEAGQKVTTTAANGITIRKGLDAQTSLAPTGGAKIVWDYDENYLSIDDNKSSDVSLPIITGIKKTSGTVVKVKYVDADGAESLEYSVTVKVTKPDADIVWVNSAGSILSEEPVGEVLAKSGTDTGLKVRVLDKSGNDLAGVTLSFTSGKDAVIQAPSSAISASNGIYSLEGQAGTGNTLDSTDITLAVTYSGKTYTKTATVKNYATITFDASVASFAAGTTITGTAIDGSSSTQVKVTGAGGTAVTDSVGTDNQDYVVKFYKEDLDNSGDYTLDLSKFSAEYAGTGKEAVSFAGFDASVVAVSAIKDSYKVTNVASANDTVLKPLFTHAAITNIATNVNSVVIDNLDGTFTKETIEVTATPKESGADVKVKSSVSNTGNTDNFFTIIKGDTVGTTGTDSVDEITISSTDRTNGVGKFTIGKVTDKVGDTVLTVSSGDTAKAEVSLKIYGQYQDSVQPTKYRYVDVTGKDAVDTAITYKTSPTATARYFYDADGYKIVAAGAAHDENGKLVLLVANGSGSTVITTRGLHTNADAAGNSFYTDADGFIQTGLIDVNGVQRYADTGTGALVTYEMTKTAGTEGKWTDTKTGETFDITEGTNAAELSDLKVNATVNWEGSWLDKISRGTPVTQTWTYTITYDLLNAGTKKLTTDPVTVTAVTDIANITDTTASITYKAEIPANILAGYYSDAKGTKALTDAGKTKTYKFKDGSNESSSIDASSEFGNIYAEFLEGDTSASTVAFPYTGVAVKPAVAVFDGDRDVRLAQGVDYTLSYKDNKKVGTGSITINGKGNYAGKTVSYNFDIKAVDLSDESLATSVKKVQKIEGAYVYNGWAQWPEKIIVETKDAGVITMSGSDGTYTSDGDKSVAITISNNVNKGSATVTATGKDGKSKKTTFKITAAPLAGDNFTVTPSAGVWAVKGATPETLDVTLGDQYLVQGQDYTVKYTYATKAKDAGDSAGFVTLTGKGNYSGKTQAYAFDIEALELDKDNISIAAYAGANGAKLKATVTDLNGVLIPAKQLSVTSNAAGKLTAKQEIEVTVKGINDKNISGEETIEITVAENLAKAKVAPVNKKFTKYYTGEAVELTEEDMKNFVVSTKTAGTLEYGTDFVISGYQNNLKKGSMTVILTGVSDKCTGTKTFKVKITAKTMRKAE